MKQDSYSILSNFLQNYRLITSAVEGKNSEMLRKGFLLASIAILAILVCSSLAASLSNPQLPIFSSSSSSQQTKQSNLSPTDDAYVIADLNDPADIEGLRTLNTGTSTFLKVWYAWNLTSSSGNLSTVKIVTLAYIKFDLASIHAQSIVSAKLNLYAFVVNLTGASRNLIAYYVSNNTWSENTLDFDNAPAFNNATSATTSVSAENQWYSFDLTSMAQNQTSGNLTVAIAFQLLFEHNQEQVVFDSSRASSDAPYLSVSYIAPASSTVGIWSSIVSFVGSSPWIYIIPAAVIVAGAGGGFFFYYSRRNSHAHAHRGFRKSKPPPSSPSSSLDQSTTSMSQPAQSASLATTTAVVAGPTVAKSESAIISCPNCSKQIQSDYSLCPYCGFELPTQCPKCGKGVKKDFTRCPYCGTKLTKPQQE